MEKSLIILKPDTVQRGLIGNIISRLENKGLLIVGMKLMQIPTELAERHYAPHKGKPFYPGLIEYITAGPVVVMAVAGQRAISIARMLMGATFGSESEPRTTPGDFGASNTHNPIHGSDTPETAEQYPAHYLPPDHLSDYETPPHNVTIKPRDN